MILRKNAGYSVSQKINLNVLVQFHFHNQTVVSSLNTMGVQGIKGIIKKVLRIKEHPQILKTINRIPYYIMSDCHGCRDSISSLNMVFPALVRGNDIYAQVNKQFPGINDAQISYRTEGIDASPDGTVKRLLSLGNSLRFINTGIQGVMNERIKHADERLSVQKEISWVVHSTFEHKSPAILFERDLSRNNIFSYTSYPKSVYSVSHGEIADISLNQLNYLRVKNPQMQGVRGDRKEETGVRPYSKKGGTLVIHSVFENKTPAVLFKIDSIQNSMLKFASYQQSDSLLHIRTVKPFPGQGNTQMISLQPERAGNDFIQASVLKYPFTQTENRWVYQYFLMHRSAVPVMQTGVQPNPAAQNTVCGIFANIGNRPLLNYVDYIQNMHLQTWKNIRSSGSAHQNEFTFSKPVIKNIDYAPGSDTLNSLYNKRRTSFNVKNENFIFHKTRKIEKEMDDLKKIVVETKKAVAEKSASINLTNNNNVKSRFDINRIADQVYQNIERRIRIEREGRGI
jgi:hypothetical protein